MSAAEKFTEIYRDGHWRSGHSVSGSGSELAQTQYLRAQLYDFCLSHGIETFLDCPCGDLHWMSTLLERLPVAAYIGADIVPEIVAANAARYEGVPTMSFVVADVITDLLPASDFVMVRDCLVHLPYRTAVEALRNLSRQPVRYVGITTFMAVDRSNTDIELGEWRPLNLLEYPYSLPFPVHVMVERCTEGEGNEYADKCLGVWTIEQLRDWAAQRKA